MFLTYVPRDFDDKDTPACRGDVVAWLDDNNIKVIRVTRNKDSQKFHFDDMRYITIHDVLYRQVDLDFEDIIFESEQDYLLFKLTWM